MSILPTDSSSIATSTITDLPTFKEYAWSFETNDLITKDGDFVVLEENEALKIWIYKVLKTPRFRHLAYSLYYGNEFERLVGQSYDAELAKVELKRLIEKCLLISKYITSIDSVDVSLEDEKLIGTINITTIYSATEMEVDLSV